MLKGVVFFCLSFAVHFKLVKHQVYLNLYPMVYIRDLQFFVLIVKFLCCSVLVQEGSPIIFINSLSGLSQLSKVVFQITCHCLVNGDV